MYIYPPRQFYNSFYRNLQLNKKSLCMKVQSKICNEILCLRCLCFFSSNYLLLNISFFPHHSTYLLTSNRIGLNLNIFNFFFQMCYLEELFNSFFQLINMDYLCICLLIYQIYSLSHYLNESC